MLFLVPQAIISVLQSSEGSVSGLNHFLICRARVANGVSPSLVMVNWDREVAVTIMLNDTMPISYGLRFTRIITFSPILTANQGQYTCSVSVDGFSEADNSADLMVVVNGKQISCMYITGICQKVKVTQDSYWSKVRISTRTQCMNIIFLNFRIFL